MRGAFVRSLVDIAARDGRVMLLTADLGYMALEPFSDAYPERFLTGERPEPAFLIAKPFQPATVSAIISQALFFERKAKRRAA